MRIASAVALLAAVAIVGVRDGMLLGERDRSPAGFLVLVAISFFIASWCWFDGRVRGKPVARVGAMLIFVGASIGYPVYCVWSRGLRGLLFLVLTVLVYTCVFAASSIFTTIVVHGLDRLPE